MCPPTDGRPPLTTPQAEAHLYNALTAHATPFITPLDEASVSLAALTMSVPGSRGCGGGNDMAAGSCMVAASSAKRPAAGHTSTTQASSRGLVRLRFLEGTPTGFDWTDARRSWEAAAHADQRAERLVGRGQPAAEARRLRQRLMLARLEAVPGSGSGGGGCSGGGDALFEALSSSFWGTPTHHLALRQASLEGRGAGCCPCRSQRRIRRGRLSTASPPAALPPTL